jgi:hypothetical protein
LKYLTLDRKVNVCYLSSLFGYFADKQPRHFTGEVNDSVFLYLLDQHYIGLLLQSLPQERRNRLLANLIKPSNWAISTIIIELIDKDRLSLFPHYLADFVISSIVNKAPIDSQNIGFLMSQICPFARRQKVYILDLLKANESLAAVRCHWHPEETVKDMGIDIYFSNEALIPTFKAVCNCNLKWKTTFFTYSWKTYDTLSYGSDDDICNNDNCGCLLQGYEERYIGLGDVYLGKSSCKKYGKEAYKQWEELGQFPHSKNRKLSNHS